MVDDRGPFPRSQLRPLVHVAGARVETAWFGTNPPFANILPIGGFDRELPFAESRKGWYF